ncbi:MAG: hypothetical protein PWQ97_1711 [Tepidanaerobacteraceae bacterium]|nr:hypothetical protein [Tepidanaerobacteraceae bacterium]
MRLLSVAPILFVFAIINKRIYGADCSVFIRQVGQSFIANSIHRPVLHRNCSHLFIEPDGWLIHFRLHVQILQIYPRPTQECRKIVEEQGISLKPSSFVSIHNRLLYVKGMELLTTLDNVSYLNQSFGTVFL